MDIGVKLFDLSLDRGVLLVRQGKGEKHRRAGHELKPPPSQVVGTKDFSLSTSPLFAETAALFCSQYMDCSCDPHNAKQTEHNENM